MATDDDSRDEKTIARWLESDKRFVTNETSLSPRLEE